MILLQQYLYKNREENKYQCTRALSTNSREFSQFLPNQSLPRDAVLMNPDDRATRHHCRVDGVWISMTNTVDEDVRVLLEYLALLKSSSRSESSLNWFFEDIFLNSMLQCKILLKKGFFIHHRFNVGISTSMSRQSSSFDFFLYRSAVEYNLEPFNKPNSVRLDSHSFSIRLRYGGTIMSDTNLCSAASPPVLNLTSDRVTMYLEGR